MGLKCVTKAHHKNGKEFLVNKYNGKPLENSHNNPTVIDTYFRPTFIQRVLILFGMNVRIWGDTNPRRNIKQTLNIKVVK